MRCGVYWEVTVDYEDAENRLFRRCRTASNFADPFSPDNPPKTSTRMKVTAEDSGKPDVGRAACAGFAGRTGVPQFPWTTTDPIIHMLSPLNILTPTL